MRRETRPAETRLESRLMVVRCADWPVTAAGFAPHDPVAVVVGDRVVAASAAARGAGVRPGQRRRDAQRACPDGTVVDADAARDARAFEPVATAIGTLVPRFAVVMAGECAFALRGPSRYFGGPGPLTAAVAAAVRDAGGVQPRCGAADGLFAARLAARAGTVVDPGATPAFLAPLPVTVLARPALADVLVRLGLHTLGEFAALDRRDVLGRFGDDGVTAHRLAAGDDPVGVHESPPPPDCVVAMPVEPPATRVDTVTFCAKVLADELTAKLAATGSVCTCLAVTVVGTDGSRHERLWRHDDGFGAAAMVERVRWQLEGRAGTGTATAPVERLVLAPDAVVAATGAQLGFFGGRSAADERAARGLARVQGLLGADAVGTAVRTGGRGPAQRFRVTVHDGGTPTTSGRPGGRSDRDTDDTPWPGAVPAPSPARVHPQPLPAEVVGDDGSPVGVDGRGLLTGRPARMTVPHGTATDTATLTGWSPPWPEDSHWWDARQHRRVARMQVTTADGHAHLLLRRDGRWFVEATYD